MWVYQPVPLGDVVVYTVGYYDQAGYWYSESTHDTQAEAAARTQQLNDLPGTPA